MAIIVSLSSRHKEKCPKSADLGHFFGCVGRTLNSFSRSDTAKAKLLSHAFFLCLAPILCNIRGFCAIPSPRIFGYFADSPHSEIKKPRHEARLFYLARSTENDITGFLGKSACDKAFSDFFYIFSRSV